MKFDPELTSLMISVFAQQSDRDKQRLVGASNFSNPCNKCLAEDLLQVDREESVFKMGAVIGTAIHGFIEDRLLNDAELNALFDDPEVETRLTLGDIEGYGTIRSTADLYVPSRELVMDHKTTTRAKLAVIETVFEHDLEIDPELFTTAKYEELMETLFKVITYINQLHAYAKGIIDSGKPVQDLALNFIPRDSTQYSDIKVFRVKYDPIRAQNVWDRVVLLWQYLQEGKTPHNFDSSEYCWYCRNRR